MPSGPTAPSMGRWTPGTTFGARRRTWSGIGRLSPAPQRRLYLLGRTRRGRRRQHVGVRHRHRGCIAEDPCPGRLGLRANRHRRPRGRDRRPHAADPGHGRRARRCGVARRRRRVPRVARARRTGGGRRWPRRTDVEVVGGIVGDAGGDAIMVLAVPSDDDTLPIDDDDEVRIDLTAIEDELSPGDPSSTRTRSHRPTALTRTTRRRPASSCSDIAPKRDAWTTWWNRSRARSPRSRTSARPTKVR